MVKVKDKHELAVGPSKSHWTGLLEKFWKSTVAWTAPRENVIILHDLAKCWDSAISAVVLLLLFFWIVSCLKHVFQQWFFIVSSLFKQLHTRLPVKCGQCKWKLSQVPWSPLEAETSPEVTCSLPPYIPH